jgi:Tol biopolymer transport system component
MTGRRIGNAAPLIAASISLLCGGSLILSARPQQAHPYDIGRVSEPKLFAEGVISTEDDELNGAFSPDGNEYYFSKVNQYTTFPRLGILCVSRYRNHQWSEPEVLPFSGKNLDFPPRLSPDGNTLFFSSSRPIEGKIPHALKIWSVHRTADGWGEPAPLPPPINALDNYWNWAPSVTKDGTLYFASTRDGTGHPHIYRSRLVNGAYVEPEKLGPEINSDFNDADPYVSPDERILIFASVGGDLPAGADRPETVKGGGVQYPRPDLYASFAQEGHWTKARHLEHHVNTFADESSPSITPDGKYLFFSSERSLFTVPTSHRLNYQEIETMLHSVLNGHGNVFFISMDALDIEGKAKSK